VPRSKNVGTGRPGRRAKLIAMATMAAYAAATQAAMSRPAARAQQTYQQAATSPVPAQLPVRPFRIPAGPLDAALELYRQQSGLTLRIDIPLTKLTQLDTAGVNGLLGTDAALRQLLAGSGLSYTVSGTGIVIGLHDTQSVQVTSTLPDAPTMTKFTEPLVDTPQTVVEIPAFILHDQQNRTLQDAVRNVPGISIAAGESGAQGDNLTIRGFTARNDIFLDGIRDFGSYYRDSFNYEQVEVLEGPAGVQFGRGSTGGVISQVSKVPELNKFVNVETLFGTDLTRRITADINEPLPDLAPGAAFRVNVMGTEGGVAGRPYAENRRFGLAPSLSFGLNGPNHVTASYFHFTESDTPDYGLPWFQNGLAQGVNRHSYFGFPDENFLRTNDDIFTLKANRALRDGFDVHTIFRFANYPRDVQITEPQICGNVSVSTPVGGYAVTPTNAVNTALNCTYTPSTPPAQITVNRNQLQIKSVEGDLWDQTELTARFKLFGIKNDFAGGAEGGREVSNPIRTSYAINKINTVPSTNLVTPTPTDVFSGTGYISSITHVTSKSAGVYFVDTLKLGRLFELSGGVRWDYFDTYFRLDDAPSTSLPTGSAPTAVIHPIEQVVTQPTYRAAFVYKPNQHGSVYFDYGTSFNPSAESLSLSVASRLLPPEENETYEAGAKYSLMHERLMLEGAWFHTTKDNARETDPTNSNNIILAGNQLVKGVQASAVGRLGGGTDLILGYAYLDSAVTYSKLFPTSVGYPLANVPKQTFNAFLTHNLPFRLNIGFGGNYVASRTASSTTPYVGTSYGPAIQYAAGTAPCNLVATSAIYCSQVLAVAMKQVPGYWAFNMMVKRPITNRIELQANIYNLLNRFYIDQPHPSHLIPAAGINALIGASFRF
jgi:catecholate siderophore receptor